MRINLKARCASVCTARHVHTVSTLKGGCLQACVSQDRRLQHSDSGCYSTDAQHLPLLRFATADYGWPSMWDRMTLVRVCAIMPHHSLISGH